MRVYIIYNVYIYIYRDAESAALKRFISVFFLLFPLLFFLSICVYIYRDTESAALKRVASAEEVLDRVLRRHVLVEIS